MRKKFTTKTSRHKVFEKFEFANIEYPTLNIQ